ncbi:MAG: tRNA (adenosine(37)-N6)-threonylcarbamoyltransferase complex transferase subunit TsaD [Chlamydiae bacterium RIFCSPLOWO2_01_FULL_28_7]|nr:MAG: tRNA (adenosine(37)-N6)-threonylcarbamoyltransferase complex transferase subunit TsaD [Chlamydiae bacterium RIFCSPLOWO2_01_FULL_28_7]
MIVLGIESTCDETSAGIVIDGKKIISNIIHSQIDIHKPFKGVFPELASRSHVDKIIPVIEESLKKACITLDDIDLIAVAGGPGLIGSILIGMNTAKALSIALNKPYISVNHVEAHLYASMMSEEKNIFPSLGVVVSGGHTMLLKIDEIGKYSIIGTTIDDAIGECFDKVASILDLPYPGGPEIEKIANFGDESKYIFKKSKIKNRDFDFSFSGLKTRILYLVKGQSAKKDSPTIIAESQKKDIAASFQKCAFEDLFEKTIKAFYKNNLKAIYFGGGVSNNNYLRKLFEKKCDIKMFWPSKGFSLDNAAMIAGLGYHKFKKNNLISDSLDLEVKTSYSSF